MKRRGFPGMGAGFPGGMNINKLLKDAQKMQADLQKNQEEITSKEFETTVGGGAVSVVMAGTKKVKSINIDQELINSGDKEMIEDLVILGINEVISKIEKEEKKLTDGLNLSGLGF